MVATTAVTSGLGFIFWWLAASWFPPEAVGFVSAAISAMLLLGMVGVMGFGTLLIGELPRQPGRAGSHITIALLVAGTVSGGLGLLFAIAAPHISAELEPLANSSLGLMLFSLGVSLTAITLVLDQAMIGLLRGELQLWRNGLFAIAKLGALLIVGIWFADRLGLTIFATWVVGLLVSLASLAIIILMQRVRIIHRPQWGLIRSLGGASLRHHALNMALKVPGFALPVMVTVLLSAAVNASFYVAWMIASFVYVAPNALTTVLYAVGAADLSKMGDKTRFTLRLSFAAGLLGCVILAICAYQVLSLFGGAYADQAALSLRILALGVFPMIIKVHYVAISRVNNRISKAAVLMAGGGALLNCFWQRWAPAWLACRVYVRAL